MGEIDLDALERRHLEARLDIQAWLPLSVVRAIEDVPTLIAEVRRLRELRALEQNALAGAVRRLAYKLEEKANE